MKTSTLLWIGAAVVVGYYLYQKQQSSTPAVPAAAPAAAAAPTLQQQIGAAIGGYVGDQASQLLTSATANSNGYNS
jgi:hypothetical protein